MKFDIRPALPIDAENLTMLAKKTFFDTFSECNDPNDMEIYSKKTYHPEYQLKEIQDPAIKIFLAWEGKRLVGYAQLQMGIPDPCIQGPRPIMLQRLYVESICQGKGLAHELMKTCIDTALAMNYQTLWLGVWEQNPKALRFYQKWGFRKVGSYIFHLGLDPQKDLYMELNL